MPKGTQKVSPHSQEYGDPHKTDIDGIQLVSIDGTPTISGSVDVDNFPSQPFGVDAGENATIVFVKIDTSTTELTTLIAAQGANTATEIRGLMISNGCANLREFHIRFAATSKVGGYAAANGGAFNWNFIGGYPKTANNQAVHVYSATAGVTTAIVCVLWKKA